MTTALRHAYAPRGLAKRLFSTRDGEVLMAGPAGTGKSRACLEKLHAMALLNPGMRGLIVRKTLTSLGTTALDTWRKFVATESILNGDVEYYGGSASEPAQYRYTNGSAIVIGGMDRPSKIMSSEYDVVYVQEATELTENDWEAITTRLRNWKISFQQLMADCNPDTGTHWLKVRFDKGATASGKRITMLESRHEDNPRLYDDAGQLTEFGTEYMAVLDGLTGVRKARLRYGLWVSAEGMIYEEEWDPAIHLIDRFPIPASWPRHWSIDFGYRNPTVIQWWAVDPDGRSILYREIYHTKRTVEVHAAQVAEIMYENPKQIDGQWTGKLKEPWPQSVITDHDAEGRATFENALGLTTTAAHKSVKEGIEAVQERLKPAGDGKPRLMIMRDACYERDQSLEDDKKPTCTAEEIPGYIWATTAKEQPVKENDHGCDAKRYHVAHQDLIGQANVRWM